jgi:hypothetical protein
MRRGEKWTNANKPKREAYPIEDRYRSRGASSRRAERMAWAAVKKHDAGGFDGRAFDEGGLGRRRH